MSKRDGEPNVIKGIFLIMLGYAALTQPTVWLLWQPPERENGRWKIIYDQFLGRT